MIQSLKKLFTFDEYLEFLETQRENIRYELYDGDIIQMPPPSGKHEQIVAFLTMMLGHECLRLKLYYGIPKTATVKPENKMSGYYPDVLLMNFSNLSNEPLWEKQSILSKPNSIPLVIEVVSQCVARVPRVEATDEPVRVSTNWRDDYHKKFADYEEMGIQEYWIVDYAALGSKELIGDPKQPTITIYFLSDEGEYRGKQFRGDDRIESPTFPDLNLTVEQIFSVRY
ncbi:MAG: Uma2 family endonuclease [Nostoc sp. DedVER02]|uniref:Uma2 family endonuclease n=1 Tax=unclassified Nostoc TaxID=2593658 RepID=UPI002AD4C743|nr:MULTISPECIES: Uma2 family endonuclease [unclassified Nostoc]MDZ7990380.1 Uma2 family endonuclease [Nostoc sp. DedVER02]MDZ8115928.1 Uma2 family endonuclease [Nostoc sp. DedVER01b]